MVSEGIPSPVETVEVETQSYRPNISPMGRSGRYRTYGPANTPPRFVGKVSTHVEKGWVCTEVGLFRVRARPYTTVDSRDKFPGSRTVDRQPTPGAVTPTPKSTLVKSSNDSSRDTGPYPTPETPFLPLTLTGSVSEREVKPWFPRPVQGWTVRSRHRFSRHGHPAASGRDGVRVCPDTTWSTP